MARKERIIDAMLVVSFKSGDQKAFSLLFERWNKKLCVFAFGYVKDWSLAKDITQETWKTVLFRIHQLRDTDCFGSWVMTIAARKSIDEITRRNRTRKVTNSPNDEVSNVQAYDNTAEQQKIENIKKAMAKLPVAQKIVIRLFYLEDYSLNEISEITGASLSTVKTRLFRARQKIKNELKIKTNEKRN